MYSWHILRISWSTFTFFAFVLSFMVWFTYCSIAKPADVFQYPKQTSKAMAWYDVAEDSQHLTTKEYTWKQESSNSNNKNTLKPEELSNSTLCMYDFKRNWKASTFMTLHIAMVCWGYGGFYKFCLVFLLIFQKKKKNHLHWSVCIAYIIWNILQHYYFKQKQNNTKSKPLNWHTFYTQPLSQWEGNALSSHHIENKSLIFPTVFPPQTLSSIIWAIRYDRLVRVHPIIPDYSSQVNRNLNHGLTWKSSMKGLLRTEMFSHLYNFPHRSQGKISSMKSIFF